MNHTIDKQLSEIEFLAKILKHSFAFFQYLNTKIIFIYIHATFFHSIHYNLLRRETNKYSKKYRRSVYKYVDIDE